MLSKRFTTTDHPLPPEFLEWQVKLRAWTMEARHGSPHAGVAPLLAVRQPGVGPGVSMHSIICGILPREDTLAAKTGEFRGIYESGVESGARAVYDRGIEYLQTYYRTAADFDPTSITSLLPEDSVAVKALRADPVCALLFYVFDLDDTSEERRFRCLQVNCRAELHTEGPIFDNVWWHNAVFHGKLDDQVAIRFRHQSTYDTRFGGLGLIEG